LKKLASLISGLAVCVHLCVFAGLEIDSAKIETNRYLIKEKWRITPSIIDYQSIVPALGMEIDSEKVETNRYSIKGKLKITPSIIDYQSIVPTLSICTVYH